MRVQVMSQPENLERAKPDPREISLESIDLWECEIGRGPAVGDVENAVSGSFNFKVAASESSLVFIVGAEHEFLNADGDVVLAIRASHRLVYTAENADLLEEKDVEQFSAS